MSKQERYICNRQSGSTLLGYSFDQEGFLNKEHVFEVS